MKCPRCQQENPPQAKFCLECGARLGGAGTTDGHSHPQAQLSIEDLKRQLTEALDQQTATSEILRVIGISPTDLQPVFDMIAKRAAVLTGGVSGGLYLVEGESIHLHCHRSGVRHFHLRCPSRAALQTTHTWNRQVCLVRTSHLHHRSRRPRHH